MTELEVSPLATCLGRNQNTRPRLIAKIDDGPVFLVNPELPVKQVHGPALAEKIREHVLGFPELRKNEDPGLCFPRQDVFYALEQSTRFGVQIDLL